MSADRADAVVIGAGVVGLAVARALSLSGREVIVIEAENAIGTATSSRNSEVIHAGIYYPTGSLKARLCVAGRHALYDYCSQHGIPHKRLGKLIVAADGKQEAGLSKIAAQARANGVDDLLFLSGKEARALEPDLACAAALHSPSTGIVDSHSLMLSFRGECEERGGQIAFGTKVVRGEITADGIALICEDRASGETFALDAGLAVNAAGLGAQAVARAISGLPADAVPPLVLARGCYFSLSGRAPFARLIYPAPVDGGLGVHLTLDLAGQARFGPDVEWIGEIDYRVDPRRADGFYDEIRRYWPALEDHALMPAYSGIRPKLSGPGEPAADFRIDGAAVHGVRGLINLFGIESPGLTSSLAIAEHVMTLI